MAAWRTVSAYFKVIPGGLILAAVLVLLLLQWSLSADLSFYGKPVRINTGWLMLFSAVGGAVLAAVIFLFVSGLRVLLGLRRERQRQAAQAPADRSGPPGPMSQA